MAAPGHRAEIKVAACCGAARGVPVLGVAALLIAAAIPRTTGTPTTDFVWC